MGAGERAGQFGPIAGVAQTIRTDLAFSDDDFEVGKNASSSKYRSRSEIATAIYGRFSDPDQSWEAVDFPGRENIADDEAMGERLARHIDLTQISSVSQAQRVAEIERRRSMHQKHGVAPLGGKWIAAQPGDWLPYSSPRFGNITVEVISARFNSADHSNLLTWREVSNSIFSWTPAGDELNHEGGGAAANPATLQTEVLGFAVAGAQLPGANGLTSPAIKATWTPISDPAVDRILVEYRKEGDTEIKRGFMPLPSAGEGVITDGVQADTAYQVRAALETTPQRDAPWTSWVDVTSGSDHVVPTTQSVVAGGVDMAALETTIQGNIADALTGWRMARAAIVSLSLGTVGLVEDRLLAEQLIGTSIRQEVNDLSQTSMAAYLEAREAKGTLRDAGIEVDRGSGQVRIWALDQYKTEVAAFQNSVNATFDALTASINLRVTATQLSDAVAAVAAGFVPVYSYQFNTDGNAEGWTGTNCTLSVAGGALTVTTTGSGAYIESPVLALNAAGNKVVRLNIRRAAGSGWAALQWGAGYANSKSFDTPGDPSVSSVKVMTLAEQASWTGTITGVRIPLGASASGDVFVLDFIELGGSEAQALLLSGLDTRVSVVEANLDAANAAIALKADLLTVGNHELRLSAAEVDISALTASVALKAAAETVTAQGSRLTNVEATLDAYAGSIAFSLDTSRESDHERDLAETAMGAFLDAFAEKHERRFQAASIRQELSVKIDDLAVAEASARTILQAQIDLNTAGLAQELLVRASEDAALASLITNLTATVSGNLSTVNASIATEASVRASADTAISAQLATLTSTVGDNYSTTTAALTTEASTRAAADTALSVQVSTLTSVVNVKTQTFYATTAPTAIATGDIWIDSDDDNKAYRWNGSSWVSIQDVSRNKTFVQTSAPTATATGDLWFDSDDGYKQYRWDGSSWVNVQDAGIAANAAAIATEATARANADTAIAASVTALTSTVNSNNSTLTAAISSESAAIGMLISSA